VLPRSSNADCPSGEHKERKIRARKVVRSGKSSTACRCPMCGALHKVFMCWSGRGTPRIYCPACRSGLAAVCDWKADAGVVLLGGKTAQGCHAAGD